MLSTQKTSEKFPGFLFHSRLRIAGLVIFLVSALGYLLFTGFLEGETYFQIRNQVAWAGRWIAHLIEVMALLYGIAFCGAALRYARIYRKEPANPDYELENDLPGQRLAIVYLCCGDLEEAALESLSRLQYEGSLIHILHDDSVEETDRRRVAEVVADMESRYAISWRVLRRPDKAGGKSAVTNYILKKTGGDHDLMLLADNDSYARDPKLLNKAARLFEDETVAVVQFRNVAEPRPGEDAFSRLLGGAINMFDAFMSGLYRGLWQPFVGHNAVLRTCDVIKAGGFTPGVFADDIDLTVRLNRMDKRVLYRRDLHMGEHHPPNYRSFCERSRKWSTGCAQVLRMHGLRVLFDRNLSLLQKTGFFLFCGFYITQAAIIAYVGIVLLLLPLISVESWETSGLSWIVGTFLPITIFLPVITYLRTEGRHLPFWKTLAVCAATYGSTDWYTLRGLTRGLRKQTASWQPTNRIANDRKQVTDWVHFGFGFSSLVVPWALQPSLLLFPITWLFAAKLIFVPVVAAHYHGGAAMPISKRNPAGRRFVSKHSLITISLLLLLLSFIGVARAYGDEHAEAPVSRVSVQGKAILINGEPIVIKGIHYSPWRPGTGPGKGLPGPDEIELREDLGMIRRTGANTILVYDPSVELVGLAEEYGLNLIHTFHIDWWRLPAGEKDAIGRLLRERVGELRDQPAIIAWMLGNEIPGWVIDTLGPDGVAFILGEWREAIRTVDPSRPVCHGKFALHRSLDLDREMDIVCYNIYPFYPTEVAVAGYKEFLVSDILPFADGRPILITEFGLNTLEASEVRQAKVLRQCWNELLEAGCQGGIVFSFADEWWKNYDNPILQPDWWRRKEAPNDHLRHDLDPEEYYGIVHADREPKPAYEAVREMFEGSETEFVPVATPELDRRWMVQFSVWLVGGLAVLLVTGTAVALHGRAGVEKHSDKVNRERDLS